MVDDYKILSKVESPEDLNKFTIRELNLLSAEIRDYIVKVVSRNGGHLAPNLGVVELSIALHRVLDSPKDKIIWDVSHQSYVHKILTGRKELFQTLRKFGGISGFTRREESEHDIYSTGHASSSIAYGMGIAEARDKQGGDETVAVVIGDGAMTGGIAFEALNNLGHKKTKMIVILNDNEMSISKNVGAFSSYLSRIRLDPAYNKLRDEVERVLKSIPRIGEKVYMLGDAFRESIKTLIVPQMIFEELGLRYFGPLDGHNIERIMKSISWAKTIDGPIIIHVVTKKGKGFKPAEEHPENFHGSSPFNVQSGKPLKKKKKNTYTNVFGETLSKLAKNNNKIVGITAAMPSGTGLNIFKEKFPDRFYDVGIAEQFAVTFSAGLAARGLKPVCAIYSTFLERACDQVIQDVALQKLPVVFAIDRGGLVGADGPTHHGVYDISYLRSIPGMILAAPSDELELIKFIKTAIESNRLFAIRYPRGEARGLEIPDDINVMEKLEIGKGRYLRKGKKLAFIAIGRPVYEALEASNILESNGIYPTVFDARFAKPLDENEISKIARTHNYLITIEENVKNGGFGEAVSEFIARNKINTIIDNISLPDKFIPHGDVESLFKLVKLDSRSIAKRTLKIINENQEKMEQENSEGIIKKTISSIFKSK